jgi:hypothetical protein
LELIAGAKVRDAQDNVGRSKPRGGSVAKSVETARCWKAFHFPDSLDFPQSTGDLNITARIIIDAYQYEGHTSY